MPTKRVIEHKSVTFPSQKEAWKEREAFREYYNQKQEEKKQARKEIKSKEKQINEEKLKSSFESVKAFNDKRKKLRLAFCTIGETLDDEHIVEIFDDVANPLNNIDITAQSFLAGAFLVACRAGFIDNNKNDFLDLMKEVNSIRLDDECPF